MAFPFQIFPGGESTEPSLAEILAKLGGLGLSYGRHPLGPALVGASAMMGASREEAEALRQHQQIAQGWEGVIPGAGGVVRGFPPGVKGLDLDAAIRLWNAEQERERGLGYIEAQERRLQEPGGEVWDPGTQSMRPARRFPKEQAGLIGGAARAGVTGPMGKATEMGLEPQAITPTFKNEFEREAFGMYGRTQVLPAEAAVINKRIEEKKMLRRRQAQGGDKLRRGDVLRAFQAERSAFMKSPARLADPDAPMPPHLRSLNAYDKYLRTGEEALPVLPSGTPVEGAVASLPPPPKREDPVAKRIQDLRAKGMPDQKIGAFMREVGIDPTPYGL